MKRATFFRLYFGALLFLGVLFWAALSTLPVLAQQTLSKPIGIQANNACTGSGLALATQVQLVLNGANAGTPQPCGQLVTYAGVITTAGTYTVAFKAGNSAGFSAATTATSTTAAPNPFIAADAVIPPPLPGTTFTITCGTPPAACTPPIVITPGP